MPPETRKRAPWVGSLEQPAPSTGDTHGAANAAAWSARAILRSLLRQTRIPHDYLDCGNPPQIIARRDDYFQTEGRRAETVSGRDRGDCRISARARKLHVMRFTSKASCT